MPGRDELAIALAMRRWWSGVLCDTVVLLLGGDAAKRACQVDACWISAVPADRMKEC